MGQKMRLTESEVKQIVLEATRNILLKEGVLNKLGQKIDNVEQNFWDKLDDANRGYELKEGNPTSVFDVIKGNGWEPIKSKRGLRDGMNYIGVKKALGSGFQHNGLTDEKLVEDINIFLDGRGHASLYETVNDNYSILAIDAPLNLFEKAEVNESVYGDESFNMGGSDMVRFYLNSPMNGRQVITVPFNEFANAKYKNDYLWEKAAEQGNIKLMRNGYFEVDPNDPHKAEVDRIF